MLPLNRRLRRVPALNKPVLQGGKNPMIRLLFLGIAITATPTFAQSIESRSVALRAEVQILTAESLRRKGNV